jgi:hypothetical protein
MSKIQVYRSLIVAAVIGAVWYLAVLSQAAELRPMVVVGIPANSMPKTSATETVWLIERDGDCGSRSGKPFPSLVISSLGRDKDLTGSDVVSAR